MTSVMLIIVGVLACAGYLTVRAKKAAKPRVVYVVEPQLLLPHPLTAEETDEFVVALKERAHARQHGCRVHRHSYGTHYNRLMRSY